MERLGARRAVEHPAGRVRSGGIHEAMEAIGMTETQTDDKASDNGLAPIESETPPPPPLLRTALPGRQLKNQF